MIDINNFQKRASSILKGATAEEMKNWLNKYRSIMQQEELEDFKYSSARAKREL